MGKNKYRCLAKSRLLRLMDTGGWQVKDRVTPDELMRMALLRKRIECGEEV